MLPGSVSKYCLQHSPVPVIVVRPTSKRDKAKHKRVTDPDRQGYRDILAKSESLIDVNSPRNSFFANDDEASAVTAAINAHKPSIDTHPLAQVAHAESSDNEGETGASTLVDDTQGPRSPAVLMKSPHLQNLDSPELSSESSSEDEEDHGGVPTIAVPMDENEISPGTTTDLKLDNIVAPVTADAHIPTDSGAEAPQDGLAPGNLVQNSSSEPAEQKGSGAT